jgi:predicted ATPase
VDPAIAVGLGLRDRSDRLALDQLRDALHDRRMLLVLDNFEHVAAAAPHLVALLGATPGLRMLVTSRAVLHVAGEQIVMVPTLALPDPGAEDAAAAAFAAPAIQLFLDRARASLPSQTWTREDVVAVAAICRQLDGLPLAIELAAARSRLLSPQALLTHLGAGPFEALAGGPRDLPPRQQTLRATLDWSFGLLSTQEQTLLAGLGLFAGGFTLELARAALGAEVVTLDGLASLLDHSLVQRVESAGGEQRFRLLEVVRLYALERLTDSGRETAMRERWAQALLGLAEAAEREAFARYVALGDREGEARALHKLADLAHDCGDLAGARALFDTCLAIRRAIGDQVGIAEALIGLGDVMLKQGQHDGAADCYGAALALVQARGDQVDRAWATRGLARVARAKGQDAHAQQLFAESLRLAWAQANPWGIAVCLDGLGGAMAARGDLVWATVLFGAADSVRAANQLHVVPGALPDVDADRRITRAQFGDEAFAAALEEGRARPVDTVIADALAHSRNQPEHQST